eukprot:TRINITY_DN3628_c1_g1_i1.p1 TRINITY_DN3628_c1_g1~~TRINITY_DN3628_c1_g1_i1.p1  ORF type:complete len:271 (+),score=74.79 TRINITY_DN3628_c1_g1_i1:85-813(+)
MATVAVDMDQQISAQPLTHRTTEASAGEALQWVDSSQVRDHSVPPEGLGAEAEKHEFEATTGGQSLDMRQRILRAIISTRALLEAAWRGLRGWRDFADHSRFSVPSQMDALSRARVNLVYYRSNYTILVGFIALWTVLSNLTFTVAMVLVGLVWRVYLDASNRGSVNVTLPGGRTVSPLQAFSTLSMSTLLLFWILGGSSTVFWLITTCLIVILGHATLHEAAATPAELALDEVSRADLDWV